MEKTVAGSFRKFFSGLGIPDKLIDGYVFSLINEGVSNRLQLRNFASINNLDKIGMRADDIERIMYSLIVKYQEEDAAAKESPEPVGLIQYDTIQDVAGSFYSRLTKDTVVVLQEIGQEASGRVFLALFAPSLTLLAIKRIEIKESLTRKVIGRELKNLYEVARSKLIGNVFDTKGNEFERNVTGPMFSDIQDVIVSCHAFPSSVMMTECTSITPANSPYIIGFYDAYIDIENGAVCVLMEYMNAGSIQDMLNSGRTFDEDDAAVLAFSVLTALVELHSRNILHRDIKPSNILTDCAGRIKLSDFGVSKEIVEESKETESFIGTLAYMCATRLRELPYSFEADLWSLGITMIAIATGKPPFPTNRGPWQLITSILKGPQPTIKNKIISWELRDFVHQCLNTEIGDNQSATKILDHPFITSARSRGLLPTNGPILLSKPGSPQLKAEEAEDLTETIIETTISWQLEHLEDEKFQSNYKKSSKKSESISEGVSESKEQSPFQQSLDDKSATLDASKMVSQEKEHRFTRCQAEKIREGVLDKEESPREDIKYQQNLDGKNAASDASKVVSEEKEPSNVDKDLPSGDYQAEEMREGMQDKEDSPRVSSLSSDASEIISEEKKQINLDKDLPSKGNEDRSKGKKQSSPESMTSTKKSSTSFPRYSASNIKWLAFQLMIEYSLLQSKFDAKYAQIDELFVEGWTTEGLKKVVLKKKRSTFPIQSFSIDRMR